MVQMAAKNGDQGTSSDVANGMIVDRTMRYPKRLRIEPADKSVPRAQVKWNIREDALAVIDQQIEGVPGVTREDVGVNIIVDRTALWGRRAPLPTAVANSQK